MLRLHDFTGAWQKSIRWLDGSAAGTRGWKLEGELQQPFSVVNICVVTLFGWDAYTVYPYCNFVPSIFENSRGIKKVRTYSKSPVRIEKRIKIPPVICSYVVVRPRVFIDRRTSFPLWNPFSTGSRWRQYNVYEYT